MPSSTAASNPPAGSRRFWITVCCFAVANAAVWVGYDRLHRRALLEVRAAAPQQGAEVRGRPRFWWTFNLDVAQAKPGDEPPGEIAPHVAGQWGWDGPRSLTFTPDAPLPRATTFTITLRSDRLRTPEGFALKAPRVTTVHTEPLRVVGIHRAAFDESNRLVLDIEFNDGVIPADTIAHLSIRGPDRKPIGLHPHGDAPGHVVHVITDPIAAPPRLPDADRVAFVKLSPGLRGRGGPR